MRWHERISVLHQLLALGTALSAATLGTASALTLPISDQPVAYAEEIVDFACSSDLLNALIAGGATGRATDSYKTATRRFREIGTTGTFVIWGGPLKQQTFHRSLKLPGAFVDDLARFPALRKLSKLSQVDVEHLFKLGHDNIGSYLDHLGAGGGVIFFTFKDKVLTRIGIDCGQIEPSE